MRPVFMFLKQEIRLRIITLKLNKHIHFIHFIHIPLALVNEMNKSNMLFTSLGEIMSTDLRVQERRDLNEQIYRSV